MCDTCREEITRGTRKGTYQQHCPHCQMWVNLSHDPTHSEPDRKRARMAATANLTTNGDGVGDVHGVQLPPQATAAALAYGKPTGLATRILGGAPDETDDGEDAEDAAPPMVNAVWAMSADAALLHARVAVQFTQPPTPATYVAGMTPVAPPTNTYAMPGYVQYNTNGSGIVCGSIEMDEAKFTYHYAPKNLRDVIATRATPGLALRTTQDAVDRRNMPVCLDGNTVLLSVPALELPETSASQALQAAAAQRQHQATLAAQQQHHAALAAQQQAAIAAAGGRRRR